MTETLREAVERAGPSLLTDLAGCAAIVVLFVAALHLPGAI